MVKTDKKQAGQNFLLVLLLLASIGSAVAVVWLHLSYNKKLNMLNGEQKYLHTKVAQNDLFEMAHDVAEFRANYQRYKDSPRSSTELKQFLFGLQQEDRYLKSQDPKWNNRESIINPENQNYCDNTLEIDYANARGANAIPISSFLNMLMEAEDKRKGLKVEVFTSNVESSGQFNSPKVRFHWYTKRDKSSAANN